MTNLIEYKVNLSDGQKQTLAKAFREKCSHTFRLTNNQLNGEARGVPLLLTQRQVNNIKKAKTKNTGVDIKISANQMKLQSQSGGFLGALAGLLGKSVLPAVARFAPKILAPLGVGALSGLASTGVSKILGNGMIQVADNKKRAIHPYLTPGQQKQLMAGRNQIKLTQKQKQDGGFLGMLAASLGIPLITSLLGKGAKASKGLGLQIDAQPVPYRRIPRPRLKKK